jgi:hypothetical protein
MSVFLFYINDEGEYRMAEFSRKAEALYFARLHDYIIVHMIRGHYIDKI